MTAAPSSPRPARPAAAVVLATLAALAAPAPGGAAAPPAATVEGQPIPRPRLERFVERYAAARGRSVAAIRSPAAYRGLVREALDALIDDELLFQEALRRGRAPAAEEVARVVAALEARHPTPAALDAWLASEGLAPGELPEAVRRQLAVEALVAQDLAGGVMVSDEEVHRAYAARPERFTSEAGLLPEAAVRERIREELLAERRGERVRARVAALRGAAAIRVLPPYRQEGDP